MLFKNIKIQPEVQLPVPDLCFSLTTIEFFFLTGTFVLNYDYARLNSNYSNMGMNNQNGFGNNNIYGMNPNNTNGFNNFNSGFPPNFNNFNNGYPQQQPLPNQNGYPPNQQFNNGFNQNGFNNNSNNNNNNQNNQGQNEK
jgi:hypothetical protein